MKKKTGSKRYKELNSWTKKELIGKILKDEGIDPKLFIADYEDQWALRNAQAEGKFWDYWINIGQKVEGTINDLIKQKKKYPAIKEVTDALNKTYPNPNGKDTHWINNTKQVSNKNDFNVLQAYKNDKKSRGQIKKRKTK